VSDHETAAAGSRGCGGARAGCATDELLARELSALAHPMRLQILRAACVRENAVSSPVEASRLLEASLPLVSYHARILREAGLLSAVERVQRRGAVQTRYVATDRARQLMATLGSVGEPILGSPTSPNRPWPHGTGDSQS
jgi:DNA-binding transcriptional ArsR family regulator